LIAAARHGYKYKLSLPVGGGADPHRKIEEGVYGYPIIAANRNFDCEGLIEFLLNLRVDLNVEFRGTTALMTAAENAPQTVALLLKNGADPNVIIDSQESKGGPMDSVMCRTARSALIVAEERNRKDGARLLLEYGADAHQLSPEWRDALSQPDIPRETTGR
jgi:hypothetical protein